LKLWKRAKAYCQLPVDGGLLDQPEGIMGYLDIIEDTVNDFNNRQAKAKQ